MIQKKRKFQQLYEKAKKIQEMRPQVPKTISYDEVYKLIDELELYQIQLELQNNELHDLLLKLEESRARYIDLYDFIPFGYFTLSEEGNILEVNEAGANLIGVKKQNLLNKSFQRYIAPNFQHLYLEHLQSAFRENTLKTCEIKLLRRNGPLFYAQFDTKCVINSVTNQKFLLIFITDISNRKDHESNLHQHQHQIASSDRHHSMSEFASFIIHELNHPLAVISNYLNGCIRRLEANKFQPEEIVKALKQAVDQSHRITEIILRMKNFTCKGIMSYEQVCINELIKNAIALINYEMINYPIKIHHYTIKDYPPILLDKIHIEQVVINLARNAIEAMRDANSNEPKLIIETNRINLSEIEICVIDNGPGIPQENVHKLFSPYFTTKPYGVGLGLAVSRKIVEAHGGSLGIESSQPGYTCFKFTLSSKQIPTHSHNDN